MLTDRRGLALSEEVIEGEGVIEGEEVAVRVGTKNSRAPSGVDLSRMGVSTSMKPTDAS